MEFTESEIAVAIFSFEETIIKIEDLRAGLLWKSALETLYSIRDQDSEQVEITQVEANVISASLQTALKQGMKGIFAFNAINALIKLKKLEFIENNEE